MHNPVPSFLIAATRKSSGKTTLSLGLARAFSNRGLKVQTYKKGPDYIDPLWLARASGNACYNLDFNTQSEAEIFSTFLQNLTGADLALIETNKGLFDGVDLLGNDSNAQLVKILSTPVVLVVDSVGMTRGIAPLLQGYANFDEHINIAGIILNKTGGARHEQKLRAAVEHYTDIPVLGAMGRDENLSVDERHLGLTTPGEKSGAEPLIEKLAAKVEACLDLDRILKLAAPIKPQQKPVRTTTKTNNQVTIAIARDATFGFYYEDDLVAFENEGAALKFFSPLNDQELPQADALFFGGGFPETHMDQLSKNSALIAQIKSAIDNKLPAYAECGGLMYLARSIQWRGQNAPMVGAIPGDCHMHQKPQGRGFAKLQPTPNHPWKFGSKTAFPETPIKVHEFHYSDITGLPGDTRYAYEIKRGHGIDGKNDGIIINNLLANFSHFRSTEKTPWVKMFVEFVLQQR